MTTQIRERLIYNEDEYILEESPLDSYLDKHHIVFKSEITCCWRGYVGHWLIEDEHLYLINLSANLNPWTKVGLDYLFPGENKVLAEWFSGELNVPCGEIIYSVLKPWRYLSEKKLLFKFINGKCVSFREINTPLFYEIKEKWEKERECKRKKENVREWE